ncbi:DUF4214 domain-containing protein [Sulfuricurvum sp.]|uniref:DUF4214 domain-containing protein n=1 Tax=Sulfuricurvum sp. TaxID=2025608 RepID=UPI00261C3ABC|nr:DUF4214 domain-containing protein [Sulfuricurvum sp.]MDD2266038.1 DUF4214 domain-containing protein [Sulfuricurvum sp.]MDD2266040.1 DUF4214 domain-containing protein [Sulfuricurvum sp.]MDD2783050.1 DUF4214 domain-containing protein [Sulfuricurvum sp.]MDD2783052.1 DUF4214 domain-containing protein [Sulfuricurvum sp.]
MAVTNQQVAELYVATFNRAPDADGLDYWVNLSGLTIEQIAQSFFDQPETQALYPAGNTDAEFVTSIYSNLFNRTPDAAGLAYWVNELANGNMTRSVMIEAMKDGALGADAILVANKAEVGLYYANAGLTGTDYSLASVTAYHSSVVAAETAIDNIVANGGDIAATGQTFVLTTGQDNVVGTTLNDTITGIVDGTHDTLTLGDSINGGSGADTLKLITDASTVNMGLATITSVEKAIVNDYTHSLTTLNIDNNAFAALTVDGIDNSTYINDVVGSTAVTLTNLGTSASAYVYFSDSSATALSGTVDGADSAYAEFNYANLTATTLDITLDVKNVMNSDVYEYADNNGNNTAVTAINTTINLTDATDSYVYAETYNASEGIERTATVTIANVDNSYVEMDDYHSTLSNNTINLSMSNSDGAGFEFYPYDDTNSVQSSGSTDTLNITLDNVTSVNNDSFIDVYDMENINVVVNGASVLDYIDAYSYGDGTYPAVQTYTITANADLTVNTIDVTDGGVANFTITGAGNVTFDTNGDNDGLTVDAAAMTGDLTLGAYSDNGASLDTIIVDVQSGSGNDTITLDTVQANVSTGAGNDRVDITGLDFGDALAGTLNGGEGRDTIVIANGALLYAASAANISNFEVLDFTAGIGTYDMSVEPSLKDVSANGYIAGAVTIDNAAADTKLSLDSFVDTDAITMALADATGTTDTLGMTVSATDTNTDTTADNESNAVIIATGYETINLTSNATTASVESSLGANDALTSADYNNTVDYDAANMTKLVIDGNAQATVTFTDATALTFVDASANTAGVNVDASTGSITGGVTFKGSAAADTYTSTANGDLIQTNAGADTVTLGLGDDTIRFASKTDSQMTLTDTTTPADGVADTMTGFDVITGFNTSGTDLIELSSLLNLATGDARADIIQKGAIGGTTAAAMQTFIGTGADFFSTGVVDRAVAFATDGTNGYVFVDVNHDGSYSAANDMVIELAGTTSFAVTDITFG